MITVLFRMTVLPGREDDGARICQDLSREDEGCISYTMYRRSDNPRELLLFEQWRDQDALDAHLARLRKVYGPACGGRDRNRAHTLRRRCRPPHGELSVLNAYRHRVARRTSRSTFCDDGYSGRPTETTVLVSPQARQRPSSRRNSKTCRMRSRRVCRS